jgi:hypothetical protein
MTRATMKSSPPMAFVSGAVDWISILLRRESQIAFAKKWKQCEVDMMRESLVMALTAQRSELERAKLNKKLRKGQASRAQYWARRLNCAELHVDTKRGPLLIPMHFVKVNPDVASRLKLSPLYAEVIRI